MKESRANFGAVLIKSKGIICVFGGIDKNSKENYEQFHNSIEYYYISTNSWKKQEIKLGRSLCKFSFLQVSEFVVLIVGGMTQERKMVDGRQVYQKKVLDTI